jgi:hypothetical protein
LRFRSRKRCPRKECERHFFNFVPAIRHDRFRSKQIGKTFWFFTQLEDGRWNRCGGGFTITGVPSFFLLFFLVLLFRLRLRFRFRFGRLESGDQSCDSSGDATNGCSISWVAVARPAGSVTSIRPMQSFKRSLDPSGGSGGGMARMHISATLTGRS